MQALQQAAQEQAAAPPWAALRQAVPQPQACETIR